jgi:hypothetical protein
MLTMVREIALGNYQTRKNLLFLFGAGEENGLLDGYSILHHPWVSKKLLLRRVLTVLIYT